jgi:hypothetical protein
MVVSAVKADPTVTVTDALDDRVWTVIAEAVSGYDQATESTQAERCESEILCLRNNHDTPGESQDAAGKTRSTRVVEE